MLQVNELMPETWKTQILPKIDGVVVKLTGCCLINTVNSVKYYTSKNGFPIHVDSRTSRVLALATLSRMFLHVCAARRSNGRLQQNKSLCRITPCHARGKLAASPEVESHLATRWRARTNESSRFFEWTPPTTLRSRYTYN